MARSVELQLDSMGLTMKVARVERDSVPHERTVRIGTDFHLKWDCTPAEARALADAIRRVLRD